nr:Chain B, Rab11-FIP2 NPF peptide FNYESTNPFTAK [synthetic construct]
FNYESTNPFTAK